MGECLRSSSYRPPEGARRRLMPGAALSCGVGGFHSGWEGVEVATPLPVQGAQDGKRFEDLWSLLKVLMLCLASKRPLPKRLGLRNHNGFPHHLLCLDLPNWYGLYLTNLPEILCNHNAPQYLKPPGVPHFITQSSNFGLAASWVGAGARCQPQTWSREQVGTRRRAGPGPGSPTAGCSRLGCEGLQPQKPLPTRGRAGVPTGTNCRGTRQPHSPVCTPTAGALLEEPWKRSRCE